MTRVQPIDSGTATHVDGPYIVAADGATIMTECGCVALATVIRHERHAPLAGVRDILAAEADATARLFAAAPVLADALCALTDVLERELGRLHSARVDQVLATAREALAAVGGRS